MTSRPAPPHRDAFRHFQPCPTRWGDNDAYGHVNNVVYYAFFDTAVNRHLIEAGVLDVATSPVIGLVVETGCRYFAPLGFPDRVDVGLRVVRLGDRSVQYEIALFRNDDAIASAVGRFVHCYVDRRSNRPVAIPDAVRTALERLATPHSGPGAVNRSEETPCHATSPLSP